MPVMRPITPPWVTTSSPFLSSLSKLVVDGRFAEAIETATKEIATQPDEPEAYFNRGQALVALDRFEEAVADYEKALSMDDSASSVDPETIDDEIFFALRRAAD